MASTSYRKRVALQVPFAQLVVALTIASSLVKAHLTAEQQLELSPNQHDILIHRLETMDALLIKTISINNDLQAKVNQLETQMESISGRAATPRSCYEIRQSNPSLGSGMYWIDPDGQGIGDNPIYVYCDVAAGTTSITHNSEEAVNVGHCLDPGCYSRSVVYNATAKQIKTLTELSAECHQSIRYDCTFAPFNIGDITYSWWVDRNGKNQTFWSGSGLDGRHICQCGIDGNCVDVLLPCNCDSLVQLPLSDIGVIRNKDVLPISRLYFGRTQLSTSSGVHTLGKLVCSGQAIIDRVSSSCEDLWRTGHTMNGLYLIKGQKSIDTVYCNFTNDPTQSGFQTRLGMNDVKTSPIYFQVQRNTKTSGWGVLKYELELFNLGGAMNSTTGLFTAPVDGTYFFVFTGYVTYSVRGNNSMDVDLMRGVESLARAKYHVNYENGDSATIQSIVQLKTGDQVYVNIANIDATYMYDYAPYHYTHFSGGLLQQDLYF